MYNWVRIAMLSAIFLNVPSSDFGVRNPQTSDSALVDSKESNETLQEWMKSSGLADSFDLIRIGEGPHPDPELAMDGLIEHLELRFVTTSSNQAEQIVRFQQFLTKYQQDHAIALPEKLFYEYIHTFGIKPHNACVDLHVTGAIYSVYFSSKDTSLKVLEGGKRGPQFFSITIPAAAPQEQFRVPSGQQSSPDPKPVSDAVEKFLKAYLVANQGKGSMKPEIIAEREDGYLGLSVQGAKGMVTDGYWEWLSIDLQFHNEPDVANGKRSHWRFSCSVGVKFASSPREKHPTDADSDYSTQVVNFRKKLVDQLQTDLGKGLHD